jgi:hypothetical protein
LDENVSNLFYLTKDKTKSVDIMDVTTGLEEYCKLFEQGTNELLAFNAALVEMNVNNCSQNDDSQFPTNLIGSIHHALHGYKPIRTSDYFREIAENDGFRDHSKASSFLLMHGKIAELISSLR